MSSIGNKSGLSTLAGLRVLEVGNYTGLKSLPTLAYLRHLEQFAISECPELQSVQGMEELLGLKSLVIQMPDNGYAWAQNYINGLRRLSVKKTIFTQKAMGRALAQFNANLFSKVIGAQAVCEIERGEYTLKMSSSLSATTIYALLVRSKPYGWMTFESGVNCLIRDKNDYLITVLLSQHDREGWLKDVIIEKGFKATMKVGEEGKALTVLQRIVDLLYEHSTVPKLVAYDVVKKRKRKAKHKINMISLL